MPGRILRVLVSEGERVARGATLLILEAMKMEHEIKAPRDGFVAGLPFPAGQQVDAGAVLVDFTG
jgi:biotin carboxyl carrier protein